MFSLCPHISYAGGSSRRRVGTAVDVAGPVPSVFFVRVVLLPLSAWYVEQCPQTAVVTGSQSFSSISQEHAGCGVTTVLLYVTAVRT